MQNNDHAFLRQGSCYALPDPAATARHESASIPKLQVHDYLQFESDSSPL
jgi:hypothetical protein